MAALLAESGHSVLLVELDVFPRLLGEGERIAHSGT
jgi:hypothetical protein